MDANGNSLWLVRQCLDFKAFREAWFHIRHQVVDIIIELANDFAILHFDCHHY